MGEAGITYARLAATPSSGAPFPLDEAQRYALIRLGPELFLFWALRGHSPH